jgi:hypothetical protein
VGKPEGKSTLVRSKRKWEDELRMDLRETGWRMWSGFNSLRMWPVKGCCECVDEPSGSGATDLVS